MNTTRVALFANGRVGLEVCRELVKSGDRIVKLLLHDADGRKFGDEIAAESKCSSAEIHSASELKDPKILEELKQAQPDFIITVYWAHLLKQEVFGIAKKGTVNFHPAMLPINRGWYPHVHSILDGTPTGVTLHAIDADADTGPIWSQMEVGLLPTDTAGTIYDRLQDAMIRLFEVTWPHIRSGSLSPTLQDHSKAIYHKKKEIDSLDAIDLDKACTVREIINLLRARSFGNKGFAYFIDQNGEKVFLNLRLGRNQDVS